MANRADLIAALSRHIGRDNGIRARDLAAELAISERELRKLISEAIIDDGKAILGIPATGYFIAATTEETLETAAQHVKRARHELLKASRLTGTPLLELAGQMRLKD